MPAAVSALMGTIPPEQAGVGSALNDTIGQSGSALGVAILGSLLASGLARHMPAGLPGPARHSIAGALAAAHGEPALVQQRPRGLHHLDVGHLHDQRDRRPGRGGPGFPGHARHKTAGRPGPRAEHELVA